MFPFFSLSSFSFSSYTPNPQLRQFRSLITENERPERETSSPCGINLYLFFIAEILSLNLVGSMVRRKCSDLRIDRKTFFFEDEVFLEK